MSAMGKVQNTLAMMGFFISPKNFLKSTMTLIKNNSSKTAATAPHSSLIPSE